MVLKVEAGVPLVWRSPSSLQFGVDAPRVVLDDVDESTERMIAAMVGGISRSGFDMMARSLGLDVDAASALLARLEAVLEPEMAASKTAAAARVAVSGDDPLAAEVRQVLEAEGVLAGSDQGAPDLAVVVAGWVIAPEDHGSWLRRDIPHLPVVIGDGGVTVGPLVEPGSGPCLYCLQLARSDDDPAWPAIATQLWTRPSPTLTALAMTEATAFVARRVLQRIATGPGESLSWRLAAQPGGVVSARAWTRHAACRCAAPEESDWAPAADLVSRSATRREAAASVPA
jgi:bacteriocin biosynthesis cyclodehydratase domain-containing protein